MSHWQIEPDQIAGRAWSSECLVVVFSGMNTSKRTLVVAYWWNQKSDSWVTFKPPNEKDFLFYYETRMKYSFAWNLFSSSISYRRYRIKTYCGLTLIWKSLSYFCASWKSCALVPLVLVFKSFGFPEIGSGRECRSENAREITALLDLGL